nr:MAG TPA: hypothetical protein [Caudoviricetes sp.]
MGRITSHIGSGQVALALRKLRSRKRLQKENYLSTALFPVFHGIPLQSCRN